jgi:hypothetical protein
LLQPEIDISRAVHPSLKDVYSLWSHFEKKFLFHARENFGMAIMWASWLELALILEQRRAFVRKQFLQDLENSLT